MRLKLKNEKIKTCLVMFAFACFVSVTCLCLLPLTVHAETISTLPFSYGIGSGYGYNNSVDFSERQIAMGIDNLVQSITTENYTPKTVLFYEKDLTNLTLTVAVADFEVAYWGRISKQGVINASYVDTYIRNVSNGGSAASYRLYKISSDGSFVSLGDQSINIAGFPTQGEAFISSNTDYFMFPLWTYNHYDINWYYNSNFSQYEFTGLVYAGIDFGGGGFDGPGFISGEGTGTLDPNTGELNIDFNLEYDDSAVQGKLDTIIENQEGSNNLLGQIWQAITDYFSPPTQQEVTTALQGFPVFNDLTNTIGNTKTTVNSIFDFSQVTPKTAQDVDFDYDFYWRVYDPSSHSFVTKTTTVHIVFSWFESVRTPVTLVLSVFLSLGFLIYIFRQIPNLINGVGGGASAGMSVAEHMKGSDKK